MFFFFVSVHNLAGSFNITSIELMRQNRLCEQIVF